MRPRTQKQPQVKKELCRVLDDVDVDVDDIQLSMLYMSVRSVPIRMMFGKEHQMNGVQNKNTSKLNNSIRFTYRHSLSPVLTDCNC